jgi:hypothetical protein
MKVWIESDAQPPLRARITAAVDLSADERTTVGSAGLEDILDTVREWLEEFASNRSRS